MDWFVFHDPVRKSGMTILDSVLIQTDEGFSAYNKTQVRIDRTCV